MGILDTLRDIGTAVEKLQRAAESIKDADVRVALANLRGQVADLRLAVVQLKEENVDLREQIQRMEQSASVAKDEFETRDGVLWLKNPGGYPAGPYCPDCHRNEGRWQLLGDKRGMLMERSHGRFVCSRCHIWFK